MLGFGNPNRACTENPKEPPELEHGDDYNLIVSESTPFLKLIDDVTNAITTSIFYSYNPDVLADDMVGYVIILWNYFDYFEELTLGLVSFKAIIDFYLLILTVKTLYSLIRYIKQIIPFN